MIARKAAPALFLALAVLAAACAPVPGHAGRPRPAPEYALNPALLDLPVGRWVKIHEQGAADAVTFIRQRHGGSAFDSRRGRLVLFGSDTHGKDWTNSPLVFDLARLEWRRLYPNDDPATYSVTAEGVPVAGIEGNHPWAMHTFGAVSYDPGADALIVASYPRHMAPGRFTNALAHLWPRVRHHPTWVLHLASGRWEALTGEAVHFFPFATVFESHRGVVIGYRSDGVYELSLASGRWRRAADAELRGWGNNVVYDSDQQVLVGFGGQKGANHVVVYDPIAWQHRAAPTPAPRPRGTSYMPMAYYAKIGRTVAIVDRPPEQESADRRQNRAETWLYDVPSDAWTRATGADLPFGLGMNFNLEYDPGHNILLLVADPPDEPVAIWALRL